MHVLCYDDNIYNDPLSIISISEGSQFFQTATTYQQ